MKTLEDLVVDRWKIVAREQDDTLERLRKIQDIIRELQMAVEEIIEKSGV